jgi:hypothetical protein
MPYWTTSVFCVSDLVLFYESATSTVTASNDDCLTNESNWIRVSQSHIATDGQSVCLSWCRAPSGAQDQILITVCQLLSCPWEGALSDESTGLSFVSQPAVLGQLSVCKIFTCYMCRMLLNTYTIYTRPLSVRAQYSRLCPISGSFPITAV